MDKFDNQYKLILVLTISGDTIYTYNGEVLYTYILITLLFAVLELEKIDGGCKNI